MSEIAQYIFILDGEQTSNWMYHLKVDPKKQDKIRLKERSQKNERSEEIDNGNW